MKSFVQGRLLLWQRKDENEKALHQRKLTLLEAKRPIYGEAGK
jgi:hypothetical protein